MHAVERDIFVCGDQDEAFRLCLSHEHPIKRVSVVEWEITRLLCMKRSDGKLQESRRFDPGRYVVRRLELPQGAFDSDLPDTGCANEHLIGGIGNGAASLRSQLWMVIESPQHHMGIQEKTLHYLPSNASMISVGVSSKSGAIWIFPFSKPNLRLDF